MLEISPASTPSPAGITAGDGVSCRLPGALELAVVVFGSVGDRVITPLGKGVVAGTSVSETGAGVGAAVVGAAVGAAVVGEGEL